jgi:hypothetical protein
MLGDKEQDAAIRRLEAGEQTPRAVEIKSADTRDRGAGQADACRTASPVADVVDSEV